MFDIFKKKKDLEFWNKQILKLEQLREGILKEMERLESSKIDLFEAGTVESSHPKKVVLAEKIRLNDSIIKNNNERLSKINQQIEFVSQVISQLSSKEDVVIKEIEPTLKDIEQIYTEQKIWQDKFDQARLEVESSMQNGKDVSLNPQTQEILDLFEKSKTTVSENIKEKLMDKNESETQ